LQYIGWGATALSQNTLGTLVSRLGYKYAGGFHSGHLRLTYRGWYPVVDFSLDVNDRHRQIQEWGIDDVSHVKTILLNTNQPFVTGYLRMYIPWRFTSGEWHTRFTPQAEYHFSNDEYLSMTTWKYQYEQSLTVGFTWSRQLSLATRDIYPRWGYSVRAQYSFPVLNQNSYSISSLQAAIYTPGLLHNHGLLVTAGYQWQSDNDELRYSYWLPLRFPRGYTTQPSFTLTNATIDYTFPIWYPDINISWLIYFKRLRMTVFSDFAQVTAPTEQQAYVENNRWRVRTLAQQCLNYFSAGADLLVDFHAFRFGFPVSAGVRYAQPLLRTTAPTFNLLFNISL
jgi:hypothetical protein